MKFIFGLVCLLVAISLALGYENCLSIPPSLKKGTSCGAGVACQIGLYCDATATCNPQVAIGGSCFDDDNCVPGSRCLGPIGAQTCVANGNPGDTCEALPGVNSTVPRCGSPLICDSVNLVCVGASVGDSCKQDSNCLGLLTCTGSVCTALPDTTNCTSSTDCSPLSFCDSTLFKCTPKKAASSECDDTDECVFGSFCSYQYEGATQQTCIQNLTKENGEFCILSPECKSERCSNNRCAKSSDVSCDDDEQCAFNDFCGCDGIALYTGYGKCYPDPCEKTYEAYATCLGKNCDIDVTFNTPPYNSYSGRCAAKLCQAEAAAYTTCSPAGALSVSLFTLFFALISLWILKN